MKKNLLLLFTICFFFTQGYAQLAIWNYTSSPSTFDATSVDANTTATAITVSAGSIFYQTLPAIYVSSWSTNSSFSTSGKYWEFSVSPKSGYKLTISSISFDAGRTTSGPQTIEAQYSLDGFATAGTSFGTYGNTNTSSLTTFSNSSLSLTINNGTTLTIRLWGYAASSTGNFRLNNIIIGGASSVLPISLTSFTGKAIDKNILLNWNTASEENNDYFDIQHAADGKTFTSIGTVNGAGTSSSSKDYSFVDENPYAGTTYYKLVQHDFDGKTTASKVIGVASNIAAATLSVYVASSDVKITLSSPNKTTGTFEVFDISGRKLAATSIAVSKGYNTLSVPVSLQAGVHLVRYTADGETLTQKFMK
ncbi:MAG: T9SS type A sorting domain-containing protein [Sphingobacteriales bacterium]|nr:T9SS type A sorting domain-containing protein [Sphingobacteriales bacterium]